METRNNAKLSKRLDKLQLFINQMVHDSLSHYSYIRVGAVEDELCPFIVWLPFLEVFMYEASPLCLVEGRNRGSQIARRSHTLQDDRLVELQVEDDPVIEHPLHIVVETRGATTGGEDG